MSPPSLAAIFKDHFAFLCDTDDDRARLQELAALVESFDPTDDGALTFSIKGEIISCGPPFTGVIADSTPPSYGALAQHHNGIGWESRGGGPMGFFGLKAQGQTQGLLYFDIQDFDEECQDFLDRMEAHNKPLDELQEAYGCGQNWIFFDPFRQNARQEPGLGFFSHEGCDLEPIHSADDLSPGGVTLALLAYYFLDERFLKEIHT